MYAKITALTPRLTVLALVVVMTLLLMAPTAKAIEYDYPTGAVNGGSLGIEGTVSSAPPSQVPSMATPAAGSTFTNSPITVSGLCQTGLLIKIFSNNIFVGSVLCTNGSYSLQVALFSGLNDLVAQAFDALDQSSPDSNVVPVTYNDAQFIQYGTQVTITSSYADLGAAPGANIVWPITLSGGAAPYAISVDWGDSSASEVISQASPGVVNISHSYTAAGVYQVVVRATDTEGNTGFIQLMGYGTGQVSPSTSTKNTAITIEKTNVIWWPSLIFIPIVIAAFILGGRHELYSIRHELEKSRNDEG